MTKENIKFNIKPCWQGNSARRELETNKEKNYIDSKPCQSTWLSCPERYNAFRVIHKANEQGLKQNT